MDPNVVMLFYTQYLSTHLAPSHAIHPLKKSDLILQISGKHIFSAFTTFTVSVCQITKKQEKTQLMRISLLLFLVAFHLFISETQGIRLTISVARREMDKGHAVMVTVNRGGQEKVILCKKEHCSAGKSRKLLSPIEQTTTIPTPKTPSKKQRNASATSSIASFHSQKVAADKNDDLDISEMDYTPAKRRTPIHN
ncbi:hypothetical protein Drorol1_Dr00015921 [Drosera rotundifolia]